MSSAVADSANPLAATANTGSTGNSARLELPADAVPMESLPHDDGAARVGASSGADYDVAAKPSSTEASNEASAAAILPDAPKLNTKERSDSMAIGPAQDDIKAVTPGADDIGPVCNIPLLLTSGIRHPYKISARYLSRRNVPIPEETEAGLPDPFSISVYTLKELILREWRSDWEAKPASPSSIRLIHFGKLLDDKEPIKKYQLIPDSPNVVHMSVRPPDLDEEEPKTGGKSASHGGADGRRERSGGCCVVL